MFNLFLVEDVDHVSLSHVPDVEVMEGELDGFVRVIRIENKELSDFAEARQPFALGLNKLYGLFGFGHSMFFAELPEEMQVLLGEELFDDEFE